MTILLLFFFFTLRPPTSFYTLSLHDAPSDLLTDAVRARQFALLGRTARLFHGYNVETDDDGIPDRKSTRLNSSHITNSYAVFCLKKKKSALLTCLLITHLITRSKY